MDRFPYSTLNRKHHPDIFSLLLTCHFDVATTVIKSHLAVSRSAVVSPSRRDRSGRSAPRSRRHPLSSVFHNVRQVI
jgi:hypothetical protein